MKSNELKCQLDDLGYMHLPLSIGATLEQITDKLGSVLFTTLVKENKKSTRLLSGNGEVEFHTDHIKRDTLSGSAIVRRRLAERAC
jgi:hypothetical protein